MSYGYSGIGYVGITGVAGTAYTSAEQYWDASTYASAGNQYATQPGTSQSVSSGGGGTISSGGSSGGNPLSALASGVGSAIGSALNPAATAAQQFGTGLLPGVFGNTGGAASPYGVYLLIGAFVLLAVMVSSKR